MLNKKGLLLKLSHFLIRIPDTISLIVDFNFVTSSSSSVTGPGSRMICGTSRTVVGLCTVVQVQRVRDKVVEYCTMKSTSNAIIGMLSLDNRGLDFLYI